MRKLGLIIVTLFLALPMALCAVAVSAAPLDSTVSGVYLAPDRVCNLTVSRPPLAWNGTPQTWWVATDLQCLTFAGAYRATRVVHYVYTGCPSFGAGATIADYSAAPFEYTSIRSSTANSLSVIVGADQDGVINGIGTPQTWLRVAPLASPFPYSCSGGVVSKPRG